MLSKVTLCDGILTQMVTLAASKGTSEGQHGKIQEGISSAHLYTFHGICEGIEALGSTQMLIAMKELLRVNGN